MYNYSRVVEQVKSYQSKGWSVIPVDFEQKKSSLPNWQNRRQEDCNPEAEFSQPKNVGIVLGKNSKGLIDIDLDCPEAVKLAPFFLPETGMVFGYPSNPSSHWLYYAQGEVRTERFQANSQTLVEIRGTGGYTVLPPSIHKDTKEQIRFDSNDDPALVEICELRQAVAVLAVGCLIVDAWKEGVRHNLCLSLSGGLLNSADWELDKVKQFIEAICHVSGDQEISSRLKDVETTFEKMTTGQNFVGFPTLATLIGESTVKTMCEWLRIDKTKIGENSQPAIDTRILDMPGGRYTDAGNAIRFFQNSHKELAYVGSTKRGYWIKWDGKVWNRHADLDASFSAQKSAETFLERAQADEFGRETEKALKWASSSLGNSRIKATLEMATPYFAIGESELDQYPMLLNCQNGIVDLKTGNLLAHDPFKRLTQITACNYDPSAECPAFLKFLNQVTGGDTAYIEYIQRVIGYSLTGVNYEQCFFIALGDGSNGKSTLFDTIEDILGSYVLTTRPETITAKKGDGGIPNDIARFKGPRLIKAAETEKGQHLAVSLIKQLTGGDKLQARFLNKEFFEFRPEGKLFLITNHPPIVDCSDHGIARRIKVLPFDVRIKDHEKDPQLKEKLLSEKEGILKWAIQGCLEWQKTNLSIAPASVIRATKRYKKENDFIGAFIEDHLIRVPGQSTSKKETHNVFWSYCIENDFPTMSVKALTEALKARGLTDKDTNRGSVWIDTVVSSKPVTKKPELEVVG